MALLLIRLFLAVLPIWFIYSQIVLPMYHGDPMFPILNRKQRIREAKRQKRLAEAAKRAASLEVEASRTERESWEIVNSTEE